MFEAFLISLGAGLSIEGAKKAMSYVAGKRPDLHARALASASKNDGLEFERVFREAVGVIDVAAASGEITIDGATLTALNGIRIDHEHGRVTVGGATVAAPILVTGGEAGSSGQTEVRGNTSLKSKGTEIKLGKNTSIRITGGASIKQS